MSASKAIRSVVTRVCTGALVVGVGLTALPASGAEWVSENIDGEGGPSGQVEAVLGGGNGASTWFAGGLHTFYYDEDDGNLRHAANYDGDWYYETLDGEGGAHGRVDADVGTDPTVLLWGGLPYVFYRDETAGTLRMATYGGNDWYSATMDGEGGPNGRVDSPCCIGTGFEPTAIEFGGLPYVFYWDNGDGGHVLRVATWGGTDWYFGTLDGAGGPNGRVAHSVGSEPTAVLYGGLPYVFYGDSVAGHVRMATWGGTDWYFGIIDGAGGANGRVSEYVRGPDAIIYGGLPYVFYTSVISGTLRMATWGGSDWFFGTLDGEGGPNGRVDAGVGASTSAMLSGGLPYVFYNGPTGIRLATWGGADWYFGNLPLDSGPNGAANPDALDIGAGPALIYGEDAYGAGLGLAYWD